MKNLEIRIDGIKKSGTLQTSVNVSVDDKFVLHGDMDKIKNSLKDVVSSQCSDFIKKYSFIDLKVLGWKEIK